MKNKIVAKGIVMILVMIFMISGGFININMNSKAANPTITVSKVSGNVGDLVDVTINLSNNPGIIVMQLNVSYTSNLKLVKATDANVFGDYTHSQSLDANPFVLYWHNDIAPENFTINGKIMTLTFQILNGDSGQECAVKVTYNHDGGFIFNYDLQSIQFDIVQGAVSILEGGSVTALPSDSFPTYNPSSSNNPNASSNPDSTSNPNLTTDSNSNSNNTNNNTMSDSTVIIISLLAVVITAGIIFLIIRSRGNKK